MISTAVALSSGATKRLRLKNNLYFRKFSLFDKLSCLHPRDVFEVPSKVLMQCFGFD
jgi:hypothetical protein